MSVLRLTLHVTCKEVLSLSCLLVKHILRSLTLIYSLDYRSSTMDWDLPLDQVLPIRVYNYIATYCKYTTVCF